MAQDSSRDSAWVCSSLLRSAMASMERDRILAAIDVGTNSIHMVIVRVQTNLPSFTIIDRQKDTVRLGDRDPKTGNLTKEATQRAIASLSRCLEIAKAHHADDIVAVATSAVREASNGRDFLVDVSEKLGLDIDLISGQEEARRIYLGVLSGMEFNQQPHAIIDIGGGSTELILGDGREPSFLRSTKVGAVRLTAEMVHSDPISDTEFNYLKAYARGMLERPVEEMLHRVKPGRSLTMVGTSGTIESLATIHACRTLGEAPEPLQGYTFSFNDLQELVHRFRRSSYKERLHMDGMNDRRAEIILAGAIILQEAMSLLGISHITICERALREGVIVDWMLTHGFIEDRLRFQSSIRKRSVLKAAQKYQVNLQYAERIANFALSLFDQTQNKLHFWGEEERELLWAASILHNCGHFISHAAHHKHSYYLIRNGDLLGYTEIELETIANLARYHRKSNPKKKHENYRNLGSKTHRQVVDQLSPLLRIAVALDRRQIGAVKAIDCDIHTDRGEMLLHLIPQHPDDDCSLELWSLDTKKVSFEETYHLKLNPVIIKPALC